MKTSQTKLHVPQKKRFKYIINPKFQLKFVVFMNIVAMLVISIFYSSNMYFFHGLKTQAIAQGVSSDHVFFRYLDLQIKTLNGIFAATSFIVIGALTVIGIMFSHRIAGPLYRLTKHLEEIASGVPPKDIRFRKGDFFLEIPEVYNRHLAVLLDSAGKPKKDVDRAKAAKSGPGSAA